MLEHMRTTLNIAGEIMALVRTRAAQTGKTITQIVEQALRKELAGRPPETRKFVLRWTAVPGRPLPGVDLSDRDSLYETTERSG